MKRIGDTIICNVGELGRTEQINEKIRRRKREQNEIKTFDPEVKTKHEKIVRSSIKFI